MNFPIGNRRIAGICFATSFRIMRNTILSAILFLSMCQIALADGRVEYDSREQLSDRSFVFNNPNYILDGRELPIDADDLGLGTCALLGFDEFVWRDSQYAKAESLPPGSPYVVLKPDGTFVRIAQAGKDSKRIAVVHCRDFKSRLEWK